MPSSCSEYTGAMSVCQSFYLRLLDSYLKVARPFGTSWCRRSAIPNRHSPIRHAMMADMRHRIHAVSLPSEVGEFADEVRRVFAELGRVFGAESLAGECSPPVDVFETDDTVEVVVDLPGGSPDAVRVVSKADMLLIAGEKPARRARAES